MTVATKRKVWVIKFSRLVGRLSLWCWFQRQRNALPNTAHDFQYNSLLTFALGCIHAVSWSRNVSLNASLLHYFQGMIRTVFAIFWINITHASKYTDVTNWRICMTVDWTYSSKPTKYKHLHLQVFPFHFLSIRIRRVDEVARSNDKKLWKNLLRCGCCDWHRLLCLLSLQIQ